MNNVTIIGTGPAGLTAAIYAARANLKPLVYAGLQDGGQLTTTTEIENFPGFQDPIMGPKLMDAMREQAKRVGATIVPKEITKVDFSGPIHKLWSDNELIESKTVIISTGATAKTMGLADEAKLMGRGVSTCATCDGFFYKNKRVIVVGGGDSAMEEANYLSHLCAEVILVHRRPVFRASKIMLDRMQKNPKIKQKVPYALVKLLSERGNLTAVRLQNCDTGVETDEVIDGLFYAIGHTPNSQPFLPYVDVNSHGYIQVKDFTKTKTPGIFAAGDIADPIFKQAVTAAGMGCQAAIQAARYIEEQE